jgi:hypothetical protein
MARTLTEVPPTPMPGGLQGLELGSPDPEVSSQSRSGFRAGSKLPVPGHEARYGSSSQSPS